MTTYDVIVIDDTDVSLGYEPDDVAVALDSELETINVPEQGPPGATGAPGTPGINGNTVWYGSGPPSIAMGKDGDFYINQTDTSMWGPKSGGLWPLSGVSLIGPQGPIGPTGATGATGPIGGSFPDAASDGSTYGRLNAAWTKVVPLAGGVTMTGLLTLSADPSTNLQASTKQYVDNGIANKAVRYDTSQALTSAQQSQARANENAASLDLVASANIIVNGGMDVTQENGGTLITIPNAGSKYICDCWLTGYNHTAATAVIKALRQSNGSAPIAGVGCVNLLQTQITTALSSPVAGDYCYNYTPIEGNRLQNLCWGLAAPQSITIGFWVNASVTGTGYVSVRNGAANRTYVAPFTINSANTWEFKTVTIPGDITGTWAVDNTLGMYLGICWAAGSTYQAAAANTWSAGSFISGPGQTNFCATNGNVCNVTGVVMFVGTHTLPSYTGNLIRRYRDEENLCLRYYSKIGGGQWFSNGMIRATNTTSYHMTPLPVPMRSTPILTPVGCQVFCADTGLTPTLSGVALSGNSNLLTFLATHTALGSAGQAAMMNTQSGSMAFDARL